MTSRVVVLGGGTGGTLATDRLRHRFGELCALAFGGRITLR
jgi:NADH dehydrogenase FAD-containing subunit